jgi:hypothetical protein
MKRDILKLLTRLFVPAYRAKGAPSKTVAIVVPASARKEFLPEEEISLRHLFRFLGPYDKYLVAPRGLSLQREGFRVLKFSRKFFGSAAAHNRFLMWPGFYRAFRDYEYILIYHLDSLVFSDQMMEWCRAGYDYIGAPWLPCPETPWVKEPRVGNGGFSLMKVESVLKVLYNRYRVEPASYWGDMLVRNQHRLELLFRFLRKLRTLFPESRIINRPLEDLYKSENHDFLGLNNDYFWSFQAGKFLPEFRIAEVREGLRFAFEAAPRTCFELARGRFPFGCHAWTKFDRSFWEPHLVKK